MLNGETTYVFKIAFMNITIFKTKDWQTARAWIESIERFNLQGIHVEYRNEWK